MTRTGLEAGPFISVSDRRPSRAGSSTVSFGRSVVSRSRGYRLSPSFLPLSLSQPIVGEGSQNGPLGAERIFCPRSRVPFRAMRHLAITAVIGSAVLLTACSGEDTAPAVEPASSGSQLATTTPASDTAEDALLSAAENLDRALIEGDLETAWDHYSRRCQEQLDSIEVFRAMYDINYEGRNPQITDRTARVDGSYGQVVTVDADPAASADSMNPRTWTLIDGQWRFDNC